MENLAWEKVIDDMLEELKLVFIQILLEEERKAMALHSERNDELIAITKSLCANEADEIFDEIYTRVPMDASVKIANLIKKWREK